MMFAPCVEVKRNKSQTRYISILSGLGFNAEQKRAVYEEHDMTFDLDVKIDVEDFEVVRKSVTILLKTYYFDWTLLNIAHNLIVAGQPNSILLRRIADNATRSRESRWCIR